MEEKVVTNEKKFADGLCFKKIFLIFVIFFLGEILNLYFAKSTSSEKINSLKLPE